MKINLDDLNSLPQKRLRFDFNEMLDVEGAVKPVVGDMLVSASVGGIRLRGVVRTLLKLSCHVCLRPYFHSLAVELDEQFAVTGPHMMVPVAKERELKKDDFFEELPADGYLDIGDVVYQAVTLASPVFCRCGDDCPGPPNSQKQEPASAKSDQPSLQEDLPEIDPRWNNLKTLLHKQESRENS